MRHSIIAVAVIIGVLPAGFCTKAMAAEVQCAPAEVVHKWHEEHANQTSQIVGVVNDTLLLEILSSPQGETWAIILTGADGNSCLMLSGTQMTRLNE